MRWIFLAAVVICRAAAPDCVPTKLSSQETLARFQATDKEAQRAFDRGQFAEAARHYREAACLAPKSARAFYGLGIAEAAAGNLAAARDALGTADALLPANALPLAMLVRVNVALGDTEGVRKTLREAAKRFPQDGRLHAGLSRFLAENKLFDLALAESLRFEQSGDADTDSAIALAVLENTVGAYDDAIRHASAIEGQAGVPEAAKASAAGVAGLSYESLGQREAAVKYLQRAIELAPAQPNSYLALAYLYEKGQKYREAVNILQAGRKKIPGSLDFLLPLGSNLVWAEQYQAGVQVLGELVRKSPGATDAYLRLAEAYRNMGQHGKEAQALQELARRKADYPMIHVRIAQAMLTADPADYPKVLQELEQAEKASPADPDLFYLRGKVYLATNRFQEAAAALRRAIVLRPMDPGPYYQLGLAYRKLGKNTLAKEQFDRMEHLKRAAPTP